jgi:hypothetical protein
VTALRAGRDHAPPAVPAVPAAASASRDVRAGLPLRLMGSFRSAPGWMALA